MEPKTFHKLEEEIEQAISGVVARLRLKQVRHLPSHHTIQMMAKAAVAVYEATAKDDRPPKKK